MQLAVAPDYSPEPWQPLHSLTWGKAMAWDLGASRMENEIAHAVLLKLLTPEQLADLFPPYPSDNPLVVPDYFLSTAPISATVQLQNIQAMVDLSPAYHSY
jgi:penicillin amidase